MNVNGVRGKGERAGKVGEEGKKGRGGGSVGMRFRARGSEEEDTLT